MFYCGDRHYCMRDCSSRQLNINKFNNKQPTNEPINQSINQSVIY